MIDIWKIETKALAKWTRKLTQVNASFWLACNLCFVWPPTCMDLCWLWSSSSSYASQHKLITRHLYICIKCTTCMNLSADLQICLATHCNLYASSGFENLCGLASTFKSIWPGVEVMRMCTSVHHCCAYKCYLLLLVITTKLLSFVWALNSWKHTKLNNEKISSVSYPELFSIYLHMWDPHFIKKR